MGVAHNTYFSETWDLHLLNWAESYLTSVSTNFPFHKKTNICKPHTVCDFAFPGTVRQHVHMVLKAVVFFRAMTTSTSVVRTARATSKCNMLFPQENQLQLFSHWYIPLLRHHFCFVIIYHYSHILYIFTGECDWYQDNIEWKYYQLFFYIP